MRSRTALRGQGFLLPHAQLSDPLVFLISQVTRKREVWRAGIAVRTRTRTVAMMVMCPPEQLKRVTRDRHGRRVLRFVGKEM